MEGKGNDAVVIVEVEKQCFQNHPRQHHPHDTYRWV